MYFAAAHLKVLLASSYAELVQALVTRQMASIFFKNTLNAKSHAPQRDAH
jgi:hypothetical protein